MQRVGRTRDAISCADRSKHIIYHDRQRCFTHLQTRSEAYLKLLSLEAVVKSTGAFGEIYSVVKARLRDVISRLQSLTKSRVDAVPPGINAHISRRY